LISSGWSCGWIVVGVVGVVGALERWSEKYQFPRVKYFFS